MAREFVLKVRWSTKRLKSEIAEPDGAEGDEAKVVALVKGHFRIQVVAEDSLCTHGADAEVAVQQADE